MRLTDFLVDMRAIWYKIGAIILIALIITAITFKIAKVMQQEPPPNAETFATESTCKADVSDEHGCYPSKGEDWCAAKGVCINRKTDLMDDDAFSKQCSVQSKVDETNNAILVDESADSSKSDTCCMSGKSDETPPPPPSKEPSCNAVAKPQPECPKSECPKPVYCPPCPKCPPPCPRMCPDLSKYVLKTSIPPCPEQKVDKDIYMLKSKCKQPDMSKYVLKTSIPNFKCTPCPPCIRNESTQVQITEDIDVKNVKNVKDDIDDIDVKIDTSNTDIVPPEEALGGTRNRLEDTAKFKDSLIASSIETTSKPSNSQSNSISTSLNTFGKIEDNLLDNGDFAQNSAKANFEGTCYADSQTLNDYSIQPVVIKN